MGHGLGLVDKKQHEEPIRLQKLDKKARKAHIFSVIYLIRSDPIRIETRAMTKFKIYRLD